MKNVLLITAILMLIAGCCEKNDDVLSPNYSFVLEHPSYEYSNNCFFIQDPDLVFQTYSEDEVASQDLPSSWANNAIKLNINGQWLYNTDNIPITPDFETLKVFIDDGNSNNNINTIDGFEIDHPETIYQFDECVIDFDFNLEYNMIIFQHDINSNDAIGITYTNNNGDEIGNPDSTPIEVKLLKRPYQTPENDPDTWKLFAKNCYSYATIYPDPWTEIVIGHKNNISEELNTNIPDDLESGSSIATFLDFFRLDTNDDGQVDLEDSIYFLENHLIVFPFIRPFEFVESENFYISTDITYENCKYYLRLESVNPDN